MREKPSGLTPFCIYSGKILGKFAHDYRFFFHAYKAFTKGYGCRLNLPKSRPKLIGHTYVSTFGGWISKSIYSLFITFGWIRI